MAIKNPTRGVQSKQELTAKAEWRDIRTRGEKFREFVEQPESLIMIIIMGAGVMLFFPRIIELTFILLMLIFRWVHKQEFSLPFRLPASSGLMDHNDPDLASGGKLPSKAGGISFLGNDMETRKELWLKGDDMRTHLLVFGSTGAGKALRDDERVLTPSGWRRMDDLKEGDALYTPDGRIQRVEGVYPQGDLDMWEIKLEDGRVLEACAEHLWEAFQDQGRPEVLATQDIHSRLGEGTWFLPLPDPLPLPDAGIQASSVAKALEPRLASGLELPEAARGSVEERRALINQLFALFGTSRDEKGRNWRVGSEAGSRWIVEVLRSLGHLAFIKNTDQGWVISDRKASHARIASIRPTGSKASCRCIEVSDPRGLFVAGDSVVTHNTETLISLAFNSLVHGSGFIYVDGKGDNSLWAKIYSICRSMGREDDLLVVNFMTGGRDVFGPQKNKLSNTLNPFSTGSAGGLTELLVGLMDEAGGDNAMWKGRAISLISGIMFALVYMRENEGFLLDVDQIRDYLILDNIQKLAKRRDLPPSILASIRAYLRSLPGYQESAPKQSETVMDQHGYLQMQFTRILGSLSDTYGYIFRTNLGEVDFVDVVINRRVLVVLLPALEKSQDELGNLGKIIVASLKQMMATGLGDTLEGDFSDVIEIKPTNSPAPYTCILDEYGYYVVKGAAVMPAQARSLGFSMVFAGQDYPAFKKGNNAEEAVSTVGNCNVKIFMKLEDPTETFDLFKQSVGEALVSKTGGFSFQTGMVGGYLDQQNANVEWRSRGNLLDLKDHGPGEAHIIFKSTLVRANMFYVNPQNVKKLQLNHFIRVAPPDRHDMMEFDSSIEEMRQKITNTQLIKDYIESTTPHVRLTQARDVMEKLLSEGKSPVESVAAAVAAAHQVSYSNIEAMSQNLAQDYDEDEEEGTINIFSRMEEEDDRSESDYEDDERSEYGSESAPVLLDEANTRKNLAEMEKASGSSDEEAQRKANAMAADMRAMSSYPNPQNTPEAVDPDEIIGIIQEISDDLDGRDD